VAAQGARAAGGDAGDRFSQRRLVRGIRISRGCIQEGFGPNRLRRRPKREYRWANGHYERIPELASELVGRKVAVIFASGGDASARAAKVATSSIPVVFLLGGDPVAAGLVPSLGRPDGSITGVTLTAEDLEAKRLELLHEMVPKAGMVGVLINPANPRAEIQRNNIQAAAEKLGLRIRVVHAGNPREFDGAIASAVQQAAGALLVASDPLFNDERERLVALVARHAIPAMYFTSDHAKAGGLLGYGSNTADMYRQAGIYAGRILKGSKPSELPVLQPTRYELIVNLVTAKTLDLEVSTSILLRADEVIE
jgi:putative ABC transport system substrate-binding protein